jgi:ATP-dependent exoDNAse (exonuclease V) beta subunit
MDNSSANDYLNAAYMSMLNRNITGVGNNPITTATGLVTTTTTTTHLTNKNTTDTLTNTTATQGSLTQKQIYAIDILSASLKDALFISEGEEPFQTVHISTGTGSTTPATTTTVTATPLPTEQELRTLLHTTRLLPSFQSLQEQQQAQDPDNDNDDDDEQDVCERSSDLGSILTHTDPGSEKITRALNAVFDYPLSSSAATTTTKNDKVMLYRITDPSSSTRVHIWILGWVDGDLIGLHTVSIES